MLINFLTVFIDIDHTFNNFFFGQILTFSCIIDPRCFISCIWRNCFVIDFDRVCLIIIIDWCIKGAPKAFSLIPSSIRNFTSCQVSRLCSLKFYFLGKDIDLDPFMIDLDQTFHCFKFIFNFLSRCIVNVDYAVRTLRINSQCFYPILACSIIFQLFDIYCCKSMLGLIPSTSLNDLSCLFINDVRSGKGELLWDLLKNDPIFS